MLDTSGLKSKMEPGQENHTLYMLRVPSSLLLKPENPVSYLVHCPISLKPAQYDSPGPRKVVFKVRTAHMTFSVQI